MRRREFIHTSMAGLVGASVFASIARAGIGANDRIQVGCIGLGGMGQGDMGDFLAHPDMDVVALCDLDQSHLDQARKTVKDSRGLDPETFHDFRDLLEKKNIDAVCVATPDHWHGIIAALACNAGKDVYVEKPLVNRLAEGRLALDAAVKHSRITQMGTQVHQTDNYHQAAEVVRSGVLGTISQVRVWITGNDAPKGIGAPADEPVPEGLDYDFWLGPTPQRPYNKNRSHFYWRYFWDYGGGQLGDFGCHYIDLVYMAMNPGTPTSVSSVGGRYLLEDNAETPDTQTVVWEYGPPPGQKTPFQLVWTHCQGNAHGQDGKRAGVKFLGSEGTLIADYNSFQLFDRDGKLVKENQAPGDSVGKAGVAHKREFLDCIRSRSKCSCDIEYAYRLTTIPLIGNVSQRIGRRLTWDGASEQFTGDPAANRLLTREYRKGWDLAALGLTGKPGRSSGVRKTMTGWKSSRGWNRYW